MGDGATREDHILFKQWYEADRRNADAYDRMAAIWSGASRISASPKEASTTRTMPRSPQRSIGRAMAACLVAGLALGLVLFGSGWVSIPAGQQLQSFATGIGEIRQVSLPDGTRLVLDSASRIEARFSGSGRMLTLAEGRARFIVAHESRPFVVSAGASQVVATGTIFDVSLIHGRLSVVLLEGSVEVRQLRGGSAQKLSAGQRLVIGGEAPAVSGPVPRGETLWPSRMLEFDDTPLHEVAALANRYSKTQLEFADEHIASLRVSGAYRAGDIEGLARSLAAAFELRLVRQADGNLLLVERDLDSRGSSAP